MKKILLLQAIAVIALAQTLSCTREKPIWEEKMLQVLDNKMNQIGDKIVFVAVNSQEELSLKGNGGYRLSTQGEDVVSCEIKEVPGEGTKLVVTGKSEGDAVVTVVDKEGISIQVDVTVGEIGSRQTDSLALVQLYVDTGGRDWIETWPLDFPINYWKGVKLNDDGRVVGLVLQSNALVGKFPKSVSRLFFLEKLDLSMNGFSGELPYEINKLVNLKELNLFSMHNLSVSTQTLQGLTRLRDLEKLSLVDLVLDGDMPEIFSKFKKLKTLELEIIGMTSFPSDITEIPELKELTFYGGIKKIPVELSSIRSLERLNLSDVGLSGEIPRELANLENLKVLNLSRNKLSGAFPEEMTSLKKLTHILVSDNNLTKIPSDFSNLDSLKFIDFSKNDIEGKLPKFGNLDKLRVIDLSGNKFSGTLNTEWGNLKSIEELYLMNNELTGDIPYEFTSFPNLFIMNLSFNYLTGNIPEGFADREFKSEEDIVHLNFAMNSLSGTLPEKIKQHPLYQAGNFWVFNPQREGYGIKEN